MKTKRFTTPLSFARVKCTTDPLFIGALLPTTIMPSVTFFQRFVIFRFADMSSLLQVMTDPDAPSKAKPTSKEW